LGEEPTDPARLKALLAPYPTEEMTCWPVHLGWQSGGIVGKLYDRAHNPAPGRRAVLIAGSGELVDAPRLP
jgi:hypothetical protein